MKALSLALIMTIGLMAQSCGETAKASDPPDISCKILNEWDFKRCENNEVICYVVDSGGLSCKWKE